MWQKRIHTKNDTHKGVADQFNRRNPLRLPPITRSTVGRLLNKFKIAGNVVDAPRSKHPRKICRIRGADFSKSSSKPKKINTTNVTGIGHTSDNNPIHIEISQVPSVLEQKLKTCIS